MGARLLDLCAATAELRRRLAATGPRIDAALHARLAALVAGLPEAAAGARDRAALMALLDELAGLVGQLELEREAARSRIAALERHRQAQRSYDGGRPRR